MDLLELSSNVTCDVFNGLYLRDGFSVKANYSAVLSTYYSASVSTFSGPADAAQAINAAVAATTNNLIRQLVDAEALTDAVFVLLIVNKVFHKVVIEVDEKGTEAAGAGGVVGITSVPPSFTLDRPFVAIVWNSLHSVNMFTAYVASPAS
ncbi:Alpha-1-antitrypsin-like protein CM55-MS [Amphibalanus amphitrite]|uniref:Alpha-1-antitrypsin-like protein CM55-MS n=1 Tax=Amphibalanus amphitrite TaxID=1232801 RepID=A0A6A4V6J3_AMPAM|nr:Alpha-1-antitrypsin-like protein CM55-MS [Amphibalanus amphitrite]